MSRHFYPKVHFVENHQTVAESKIEMEFILCLLLRTLHFLNNFYDLIKHLYGSSLSALQYWSNNRKYLLKKAGDAQDEFPKIPQHLTILLGADEEISIADLVKLVKWSVDYSIAHISFYDFDGSLQNEENLFRMEFESLEPSIAENVEWTSNTDKQNDDMTTIKKFTNPESVKSDTCKNDDTLGFRLKIRILSCNEGKEKIVILTKILAQFAGLNYIQERDITAELLNQKLTAHGRIPDPDVAIVFGNTLHHYGFLPWQSSITEFFLLPTHHDLSVNSFREILFKFSKCQQRYGK